MTTTAPIASPSDDLLPRPSRTTTTEPVEQLVPTASSAMSAALFPAPLPRSPMIRIDDVGWWSRDPRVLEEITRLILRRDAVLYVADRPHVPILSVPPGMRVAWVGACGVRQHDGSYAAGLAYFTVPDDARAHVAAPDERLAAVRMLIDADEAAGLLGISRDALYTRVARGQVPAVVRTGRRRIQFHRERLLAALEKRSKR